MNTLDEDIRRSLRRSLAGILALFVLGLGALGHLATVLAARPRPAQRSFRR